VDHVPLTIPVAGTYGAPSRSIMYQVVGSGELPFARFGRSSRVRREHLEWLASKVVVAEPDPWARPDWGLR
jgi:hypothetical protein